jgi:hypothetical protein
MPWYAYRDGDKWRLAPSKWAGYSGLTGEEYVRSAEERDGRRTESHLARWFRVLPENSPLYEQLAAELFAFLTAGETVCQRQQL